MRRINLILGVTAFAAVAYATPACITGTYASYVALGSGGCVLGDSTVGTFSNLSFVNTPDVPPLPAADIEVVAGGTLTAPTLTFIYTNAAGVPTPVNLNTNGSVFSFGFNYQMTPNGANLTSIQEDSTFSNTTPGSVSATKSVQLQSGGTVFTSTVSDQGTSHNPSATLPGSIVPVTGSGTWVIADTISLQAQTGGLVSSSGVENLFVLTATSGTPEPLTAFMIGSGLLCLGLVAPRRRSTK